MIRARRFSILCFAALFLLSPWASAAAEALDAEALAALKAKYRRPQEIPFPASNPLTEEKRQLGELLFFDPRLSRAQDQSCASCHDPARSWSDGRARGIGFQGQELARRSPGVLNLAWMAAFMWDGRAHTLEQQALLPITAPEEMNMATELVVERLHEVPAYRQLFARAFAVGDTTSDTITPGNVAVALATFQRTLVSSPAPFDRWIEGDENAISAAAKNGFALFNGKAGCSACHSSWRFTDDSFHDIGLDSTDIGRGRFAPPSVVIMQHAFKTPTLRDLDADGFFMHDGSMRGLEEVIAHYEKGGNPRPSLSHEIHPIELSASERAELIEFLHTLKGEALKVRRPTLPPNEVLSRSEGEQ